MTAPAGGLPIVYIDGAQGPHPWVDRHASELRAATFRHGAVLVRGPERRGQEGIEELVRSLAGPMMVEREGFAPRRRHGGGLYSSVDWPHNEPMCMHHELSYITEPPGLLIFACLTPPGTGGAIGLADAATMARRLPRELVDRFEREGWLLSRTFSGLVGIGWSEAFGTDDRAAVAAYCRANAIDHEWRGDGSLRTRQRRPSLITHPVTGDRCWFNQIAFLNEHTMDPDVRTYLRSVLGEDLPFNTGYGGGAPVARTTVQLINETYAAHTLWVPLRTGDLLMVDNIRMAHSREAYQPPREVLVAMAQPVRVGSATWQSGRAG